MYTNFKPDYYISPVQVPSKLDPIIEDISDIKRNADILKSENIDLNDQIKELNNTVSNLRNELEEERKKNKYSNIISAIFGVLVTIFGGLILHWIISIL